MTKRRSTDVLERFLTIALLASLAIAQPLLELVGKQAEFLVAHQLGSLELFLFALVLGVLIPALSGLVPFLAGKLQARLGTLVFYFLFAVLAGLIALPFLIRAGMTGNAAVLVAGAVMLVSPLLYHRFGAVRLFFKYLSPAVLIFPVAFLFFSRATALLLPGQDSAGMERISFQSKPDIVFIVLDEFPLVSLLDSGLEIDRQRYPNFARLADQASWYRAATSPAETTVSAVPALLTGLKPDPSSKPLPTAANYPRNLFTLLQNDYRMIASETATRLCPGDLCQPGEKSTNARPAAESLLLDLLLIYRHIVTPSPWSENLPSVSKGWSGFTDEQPGAKTSPQNTGLEYAQALAELSQNVAWNTRAREVDEFISNIKPRPEPVLYYLHSLLPHAEWRYLKSGQQYLTEERWEGLTHNQDPGSDDFWVNDAYLVNQFWQRHLLQVQYVDTLLGRLLDRLESEGMLDSTLLVITGDHGASFVPGQARRSINEATLSDISAVPLLIRFPGQQQGEIDDQAASLIDILPTLVDALGISVAWTFDGQSLKGNRPGQDRVQVLQKNGSLYEYPLATHFSHLRERVSELASTFNSPGRKGLFSLGPFPELQGRSLEEFVVDPVANIRVEIEGDHLYRNVQTGAPFVPRLVRGEISGLPDSTLPRNLAIVVNGRIAATTRTMNFAPYRSRFSAMLGDDVLQEGANDIQVYLINGPDPSAPPVHSTSVSLSPLKRMDTPGWVLVNEGETEVVSSPGQGEYTVQAGQFPGSIQSRQTEAGSLVNINGSTGDPNGDVSEVLVFLDGQLAGLGSASGMYFSVLVPAPADKPLDTVNARVFVLNPGERRAWEVTYPAPCSASWLFAPAGNARGIDCNATGSPLSLVEGQLKATLDMSNPASLAYLTRNWGTSTPGIAWSLGKSSGITIPVPPGLTCLDFKALVKPFLHAPELKQQSMWLTTNGIETGSWVLDGTEFDYIEWQLAREAIDARPGTIEMSFLLPDAVSPESINAGTDQRTLGIALLRLEIEACP